MSLIIKFNRIMLAVFVMIQVYETSGIVQEVSVVDLRAKRETKVLDTEPHDYEPVEEDEEFQKEFKANEESCTCEKPLPQVVTLIADKKTSEFMPTVAIVNRCLGSCSGAMACEPRSETKRKIAVKRNSADMTGFKAHRVSVVEHTSCGCTCSLKEENCTGNMKYNMSSCKCECPNEEKLMEKCHEMKKSWNRSECTCNCKKVVRCQTGKKFDHDKCKCIRNAEFPY